MDDRWFSLHTNPSQDTYNIAWGHIGAIDIVYLSWKGQVFLLNVSQVIHWDNITIAKINKVDRHLIRFLQDFYITKSHDCHMMCTHMLQLIGTNLVFLLCTTDCPHGRERDTARLGSGDKTLIETTSAYLRCCFIHL